MKTGDRVKITKPGHLVEGCEGIVMRVEWLDYKGDRRHIALVAGLHTLEDVCGVNKPYPIYVIQLKWLEIVYSPSAESGRFVAQEIARAVYKDRGLEEFPELLQYPNTMEHITG